MRITRWAKDCLFTICYKQCIIGHLRPLRKISKQQSYSVGWDKIFQSIYQHFSMPVSSKMPKSIGDREIDKEQEQGLWKTQILCKTP